MFMWITRDVSKMRSKIKRPRVMLKKMMIKVEAPLVITLAAVWRHRLESFDYFFSRSILIHLLGRGQGRNGPQSGRGWRRVDAGAVVVAQNGAQLALAGVDWVLGCADVLALGELGTLDPLTRAGTRGRIPSVAWLGG